jgi:hypothetical protein
MATRYAGQKLRSSYVSGSSVLQKLNASNAPAAVNAVSGKEPMASTVWD